MADITQSSVNVSGEAPAKKPIKWSVVGDHAVLILGALLMLLPVLLVFATSSHDRLDIAKTGLQFSFGNDLGTNYGKAMFEKGGFTDTVDGSLMLMNSLILGFGFAI